MKKLLLGCVITLVAVWGVHTQHTMTETKLLATLGNTNAQLSLGKLYYEGQRVAQDYTTAFKWYLKAAEQGYAQAQFSVGVMVGNGLGVALDDNKAFEWYLKAAEQGYAPAQYNLAACYHNGEGVAQDNVLAYMWVNLAALQGESAAINNRAALAKKMSSEQIVKAEQLSSDWLAKHTHP